MDVGFRAAEDAREDLGLVRERGEDEAGREGDAVHAREREGDGAVESAEPARHGDELSVRYGIGIDEHDHEGRAITLEYPDFFLVCAYVPNSQDGLRRLDYRMRWEDDMRAYLSGLPKPVVFCGDLNVAHEEIDLKNPASNRRNAGFTDEERAKFSALLGAGFIDTWRFQHPGEVKYSWWSYRFNARANNAGWRIDYFVVSAALRDRILTTAIHDEITGSDHCPVELVLG